MRPASGLGALLVLSLLAGGGCGGALPHAADVVAGIDGSELHYRTFDQYLVREIGEPAGALDSRVLSRLFDHFLDQILLRRLAADRDLTAPDAAREIVLAALLAGVEDEVTEAAVEAHFEAHREEQRRPERVRLRHLLVADVDSARQAREEILSGSSFGEVARRVSIDANAERGGQQGEIVVADIPEPFAQAVETLEVGSVSAVVSAPDGHHLFLVEERLAASDVTLAEMAPSIREQLAGELADERLQQLVAEARRRYNVEVYDQNLPFFYRGHYGGGPPRYPGADAGGEGG